MEITQKATKPKRLFSGLDSLSRLASGLAADTRENLHKRPASHPSTDPGEFDSLVQIRIPSLEQVLARLRSIPEYSILIGAAQDGSPIMINLSNSSAGSLLILGDPASGKTKLMSSILASACLINSPRRFRFGWITYQPGELGWLGRQQHAYQVAAPYTDKTYQLVKELVDLLGQRRNGRQSGPAVILAIDGLDELIASLDDELLDLLLWLIANGPAYRIWTVATLDARRENLVEPEVLEQFGTWLVGFMASLPTGDLFSTPKYRKRIQSPDRLVAGAQFGVLAESDWVQFWVPNLH